MQALRALRRQPTLTAVAILLLATGIAAVTVVFAVADALLFRPLNAAEPEQLVRLVTVRPQLGPRSYFRPPIYEAWQREHTAFASVGAAQDVSLAYRDGDQVERALVGVTTPEWLDTFGVAPLAGQKLTGDRAALLSYRFWQRRYAGRPDVLGRPIFIRDLPFTIAGVLPAGFNGATVESGPDVRIPLAALARLPGNDALRRELEFEVVARLKPGAAREAARQEALRIYTAHADKELDGPIAAREFDLEPLEHGASRLRTQASGALLFALGAAALLALMVAVNVSGLWLARVLGREQEFAVRQALGASRRQLMGLVWGEAACIAMAATALAWLLTVIGLRAVSAALPPVRLLSRNSVPMALELHADWRVLAFSVGVCVLGLAVIALVPAWRASRVDFAGPLRQARVTGGARRWLLAAQVALCTVLLLAAALVQSTLGNLRARQAALRLVNCDVDSSFVPGLPPERFARAMEQWKKKVEALPGVERAAFSGIRRLRGSGLKMTVAPAGERIQRAQFLNTSTLPVSEGYFETHGIALLAGRPLTTTERYGKLQPQAVIVNETFAQLHGGAAQVIGRRFGSGGVDQTADASFVVVGVAANVVYRSMRELDTPVLYSTLGGNWSPITLSVRAAQPAAALAPSLRAALREVAPELAVEEISDLRQDVDASLWNERAVAWLSTAFAALAAVIAAVGLFSFVAYTAAARRREWGIRSAVGAQPASIARLVLAQGLVPVVTGLAAGLLAGAALGRLAESFLTGVRPGDPGVSAAVAALLLATGLAACAWPAWQASQINPATALRSE